MNWKLTYTTLHNSHNCSFQSYDSLYTEFKIWAKLKQTRLVEDIIVKL